MTTEAMQSDQNVDAGAAYSILGKFNVFCRRAVEVANWA